MSDAHFQSRDGSAGLWRSLEQLGDSLEYRRAARDEFVPGAMDFREGVSRRGFLKGLAASMAAVGIAGCTRKATENIVPYVRQPAGTIPGKPLYFATSMTIGGYAQGVIATSREGKPIKIEGNPDHPATLGSSDVFMQASILDLYDPDRAKNVMRAGDISDWDSFVAAIRPRLSDIPERKSGFAILSGTITSLTLLQQLNDVKARYPGTKWFCHDPIGRENIRAGLRDATGENVVPVYDFSQAKVILSLDCDFLGEEPGHVRFARDFAEQRRVSGGATEINRLYVLESTHTITGSVADHRWAMRPSRIAALAQEMLRAVQNPAGAGGWAKAVADDLAAHRGASIVVAGAHQAVGVHALAHAINDALQNIGKTVKYLPAMEGEPDGTLVDLVNAMQDGSIDTLLILGGNPAYTSPGDLNFDAKLEAFSKTLDAAGNPRNLTIHLGAYDDETSFKCQWHLPQTHYLEEWGDARAYDGTVSVIQPLIDPLYSGRSAIEVMELLRVGYLRAGYDIVRDFWRSKYAEGDFDLAWNAALEKGIWTIEITESAQPPTVSASPHPNSEIDNSEINNPDAFEIVFRPDPNVWDGSFSNNGFLQELPRPLTKLTWDNAALISPTSAAKLGVANGDVLHIEAEAASLDVPAWILPGQPDETLTLHLGYGRWRGGSVMIGAGFNAYKLRTSRQKWIVGNAKVTRTGETYLLVATHTHQTIASRQVGDLEAEVIQHPGNDKLDNRKLVRVATLEQFQNDPDFVKKLDESERHSLTLYPGYENIYKQNLAWGMSIDMQSCIGCNACIVGCQTENNISVVGKDQVSRGREMHWLRVDTYFEGDMESPTAVYHQPIPCMHCENAPCELVCPVGATVHDNEGINEMVYNRCVGTRYCSNNCPYKVRRFNFLQYADETSETLKLMRNPEVTVRSRGVMEKCTYCIQRIVVTRIEMEKTQLEMDEKARSAEGSEQAAGIQRSSAEQRQQALDTLQTACQQACPTRAIVFGNLNSLVDPIHSIDPHHKSRVAQLKENALNYSLLSELTTNPRTTYLARVTNPNPAISAKDFPI